MLPWVLLVAQVLLPSGSLKTSLAQNRHKTSSNRHKPGSNRHKTGSRLSQTGTRQEWHAHSTESGSTCLCTILLGAFFEPPPIGLSACRGKETSKSAHTDSITAVMPAISRGTQHEAGLTYNASRRTAVVFPWNGLALDARIRRRAQCQTVSPSRQIVPVLPHRVPPSIRGPRIRLLHPPRLVFLRRYSLGAYRLQQVSGVEVPAPLAPISFQSQQAMNLASAL